jgi:PRTRC genetic system protein E
MNTFFKQLSEDMLDRQEVRMNVKKIGDDIVVMIVPNYKDDGKTIQMSGSPEEVDNGFFNELKNFQDSLTQGLQTEVIEGDAEESKEESPEKQPAKKPDAKDKGKKSGSKSKVSAKKEENPEPIPEPSKTVETIAETTENTGDSKNEVSELNESPKTSRFDELMAEGKSLFENRSYEAAANKYKEAVDLKPDDSKALAAFQNAEKWHKAVSRLSNV